MDPEYFLEDLVRAVMVKSGAPKRLHRDLLEDLRGHETYRALLAVLREGEP